MKPCRSLAHLPLALFPQAHLDQPNLRVIALAVLFAQVGLDPSLGLGDSDSALRRVWLLAPHYVRPEKSYAHPSLQIPPGFCLLPCSLPLPGGSRESGMRHPALSLKIKIYK